MSHLSFITSVKYWLKSVPLHSHFTICNSVQCFCIILSRFICHKWTSQTLHTMQLPVFTAYSASIYTDIYKLIAVNTSIHQPCWHMQPSKILFRCDYSLFWKKWPKFRYVWMPPHADSKKTCLQTCRHNKGEECMWIKTLKLENIEHVQYLWSVCLLINLLLPQLWSIKTGISQQESFFFTFTWLNSIAQAKTEDINLQRKDKKLNLGSSRFVAILYLKVIQICVAKCVLKK